MEKKIFTWQRNFTNKRLLIYEGKEVIGGLKWGSAFASKAIGAFDDKQFLFERNGSLSVTASVREFQTGKLLETAKLNVWKSTALIFKEPDEFFKWQYHGMLNQEWLWKSNRQTDVLYRKTISFLADKGTITLHENFSPQYYYRILLGLFIRQYFR